MKISEHFNIQEFVDPVTYAELGASSAKLINPKLVAVCELLRKIIGKPVIINTWAEGGQYKESGLRRKDSGTGAPKSKHKLGEAADVKIKGLKGQEIRNIIKAHWPEFKAYGLTTIEDGTSSWAHIDVRYTGMDELYIVPFYK